MVTVRNEWEELLIYSLIQIPQDLEGRNFCTVKFGFTVPKIWIIGLIRLDVHFQGTEVKDVLKQEPGSGVIALKEAMKYFDADFFNDSKVISKRSLMFFESK
jgi:hypothetical protein